MAISDTQKIDWLWKKLGYGVAKTDVNSVKDATNEATPSPLLIRGDNLWASAGDIPSTKPIASSSIVEIYDDSGGGQATVEATEDLTSTSDRTWETGLTDWIPPEFGSTYLVKVYVDNASAANPQTTGTQLFPTGSGNEDQWFFDYQSGILNFIGDNLPSGVSGKSIYIVGARYVGSLGPSKIFFDDTKVEVTGSEDVIVEINAANKLTVNSSGLTVNGSATISNANPFLYLIESDVTDLNTVLKTNSGEFLIQTVNDALTVSTTRLKINHTTGDITLSGNTTIDAQNDLRFADADSSNYVAFQSPATVASDVTWTLPDADAAVSGYALVSDAAGTLSWAAAGATITNDETTNTNFLIYFESTTTGALTAVKQDSNFTYNPSTGTLNVEDLVLSGDLTVNGTTTTINTTNTTVSDSLIELSSGTTGAPANDSGFVVERGDENNAFMGWDESVDKFIVGTTTATGASTGNLTITAGTLVANTFEGALTGNADTATALSSAVTVQLTGDVTGSATFTSAGDTASIATTIQANSVALGTDTTGNYVGAGATSGNGISGSLSAEGGTFTVTSNATNTNTASTIVFRDASGDFSAGTITAALSGNADTASSAAQWTTTRTINMTGDITSDAVNIDGSGNITITNTAVANDAVTYAKIQNVVADNVLLGNNSGAGGIVDELTAAEVRTILNVADGAATGTVTSVDMSTPTGLVVSGNPITTSGTLALALDTGYEIPLTSTLDTFITASSTDTLTNKTIDANGTGNSITNLEVADFAGNAIQTSGEIATPGFADNDTSLLTAAAIDDRYSTIASPTFTGTVNTDNLIVGGDLTVNGTTTTVSTTNMVVEDSLIELSNGTTGAPANDSGIVIERGDENNAFIGWDESADKFIVGTGTFTGASTGNLTITTGTLVANIEGALTGNATTASALSSAVTVQLTGDVTGSATFTSAGDTASIATTIAANSVALGTDTTGNYVGAGATSGNGISGSLSAEGGTFTVTSNATNLNTASTIVFRDASGNFSAGTITAALSGNATTASSAAQWTTTRTINMTGDVSSDAVNIDGSGNITITNTSIANDAVTYAKIQNVVADNVLLGNNAGAGGIVDELTATEVRTILNVEDGATADQTTEEIQDGAWGGDTLTGTQTGITVTYDDINNNVDFVTEVTLAGSETLTNKTIDGDSNTLSNLDIGNEVDWAAATDVTDAASFEPGDKILIHEAGVGLRKIDYNDLPGAAGGLLNIVEDTTPQLGGQLDVNGNAIGDGTNELLTFVEDASAVNHIEVENEATGSGPIVRSTGDDTNVELNIDTKGTADINLLDNVSVTGNITLTGTVDGRDIDTDGTKLDGIDDNANNYTHPNHTGDVTSTGDGATVIANDAVTYAKIQNVVADNVLLGNNAGAGGIVDELTAAEVRTLLNVADGAATGTVTSVAMSVPTGLAISGTPITTSGTLALALDTGYEIPLTTTLNTFITASSTDTLTNKTIDANGTGNSITNLEVADFAGSAIQTSAEIATPGFADNDTSLLTAAAIDDRYSTIASPTFTGTINGANLILSGDLTVNGTTTTLNTTNLVVSDNLIELNNGVASNANDSGIVIERGSTGDNAFMGWDESADKFIVGTTTATGASTGDLTITPAKLSVGETNISSSSNIPLWVDSTDAISRIALSDTAGSLTLETSSGNLEVNIGGDASTSGTNSTRAMNISSGGDISFYEDTGVTAKFFWDSSAERLGIGTSGPVGPLDVRADSDSRTYVGTTGKLTVESGAGGDVLQLSHTGPTTDTAASVYIEFHRSASIGGSLERMGYFGYSATSNADWYWLNENPGAASTIYTRNVADDTNIRHARFTPSAVIFNEDSLDIDFRVESDTNDYALFVRASDSRVGINQSNPSVALDVTGDINATGALTATTKSFVIDHPTKPNMKLRYGSLEGPENGVYVRGRLRGNVIELPDYWVGLVDEDTITVNLTPIINKQDLFIKEIKDNKVFVEGSDQINCFFTVYGERKDEPRFEVEYNDE